MATLIKKRKRKTSKTDKPHNRQHKRGQNLTKNQKKRKTRNRQEKIREMFQKREGNCITNISFAHIPMPCKN